MMRKRHVRRYNASYKPRLLGKQARSLPPTVRVEEEVIEEKTSAVEETPGEAGAELGEEAGEVEYVEEEHPEIAKRAERAKLLIPPKSKKHGGRQMLRGYNKRRLKFLTDINTPETNMVERCRLRDQVKITTVRARRLEKQLEKKERSQRETMNTFEEKERTIARQGRQITKLEQQVSELQAQLKLEKAVSKRKEQQLARYAAEMSKARTAEIVSERKAASLQSRIEELNRLLNKKDSQAASVLLNRLAMSEAKTKELEKKALEWEPKVKSKTGECQMLRSNLSKTMAEATNLREKLETSTSLAEELKETSERQAGELAGLYRVRAEKQELDKAFEQHKSISEGMTSRLREDLAARAKIVQELQWEIQMTRDRVKLRDKDLMKAHNNIQTTKKKLTKTERLLIEEQDTVADLTSRLPPKRWKAPDLVYKPPVLAAQQATAGGESQIDFSKLTF